MGVTTERLAAYAPMVLAATVAVGSVQFFLAPASGDEARFLASTFNLVPLGPATVAGFTEISSPTIFIVFALLAQWTGAGLASFRVVVFACFCLFLWQYQRLTSISARDAGTPAGMPTVVVSLLLTFPYLIFCGVRFYTDVPAMMFGVLSYQAFRNRRPGSAVVWATLALHCRQFMIFVPLGLAAAELVRSRQSARAWARGALLLAVPIASYIPYVILWRDVSPMRTVYPQLAQLPVIVPAHISYLFASAGLYLLPLALWLAARRWTAAKLVWVVAAAAWVLLFPPRPNLYFTLLGEPITTLGLVDSVLDGFLQGSAKTSAFALGAAIAAALHFELLTRILPRERALSCLIVAFWTTTLFTHLAWDKYLMPVLPFLYLAALTHDSVAAAPAPALRSGRLG